MALGAKLKLGFINGTNLKPVVTDDTYQNWTRCDYMVTCWILNSMTAELSEFLMNLNVDYESVRSQIISMDPLPYVNKAYYTAQQVEKQKQVTNTIVEPTDFFSKHKQSGYKGKGESRNDKKHCTICNEDMHLHEQCFERLGFPDWYKGKKKQKKHQELLHMSMVLKTTWSMKLLLTCDIGQKIK
ncbi:uncharacterized protein [Rutidosis leptorrhynchoides]|uniref:uncharacterized protein n=1 Tax=Rutidosis leptorrhynchoides TaxID=125765 RepID=UPI003A9A30A5